MNVVIDTNVIVSGLLTAHGNAAVILNLLLNREINILYDHRILEEYEQVLGRKKFGFDLTDIRHLVELIKTSGHSVFANPTSFTLKDKGDVPFLEVAETGLAHFLITGNLKDYPEKHPEISIVAPAYFIKRYFTRISG